MNDNDMIKIAEMIDIEGLYNITEYEVPGSLDAKLTELAGLADRRDRRKRNCIRAAVFLITVLLSVNTVSFDAHYKVSGHNTVCLGAGQPELLIERPTLYELTGGR